MREMFDSVTVSDIPRAAMMVAGYANGRYANFPALVKRFPQAIRLGIAIDGKDFRQLAHVLDIENGDAEPSDFGPWARSMLAQYVHRPTAYIQASRLHELLEYHRPGDPPLDVWAADWTGHPHEIVLKGVNVAAVQFAAPGYGSPGHYDLSAVYDDTWHPAL